MSKGYRFWVDTETTGFDHKHDQILEVAGVIEDAAGVEVEQFEFRIKLKQNVIPGPMAILINKINPYSKEWVKHSITENEAAKRFAKLAKKYTTAEGLKPFFTAYNADFDKDKCAVMFSRNGLSFSACFNKSVFDPLKTARQLTSSGKLKTKINTYAGGRTAASAKLEDVAAALNEKYEGEAHRALTDAIVMRNVTRKLFKLATGHDMHGLSASPKDYEVGQVVKIVTDSKSSGAKIRHVYILENNPDKEHVIAVDEDDLRQNNGWKDTAVRQFNYGTIVGEMKADPNISDKLSQIAIANKDEAARLSKNKLKSESDDSSMFDEDTKNFPMIEQVQAHMSNAKDKAKAYEFMFGELLSKFNGDNLSAKAVMIRAENLACAKGESGWSRELFPQEGIRVLESTINSMQLRVGLHPNGHYAIGFNFEKAGRPAKELKDCKNKKDILTFLNSKVGKIPELVEFVGSLPAPESFEDPKHPAVIETEVRNALDSIAVKGAEDDVKAGVAGLLIQLQSMSPKTFSKYKIPIDPKDINDPNYWQAPAVKTSGGTSGGGGGISLSQEQPSLKASTILGSHTEESSAGAPILIPTGSDHVKPGDKLAKTPCALCGRALSANISIQHSMGPTCRKNLHVAEDTDGPLDPYRDPYRPFLASSAPRPGDLVALRFKDQSGKEGEILAEFIAVTPTQTQIIDRRKIRKLLQAGINANFAVYLSTTKLPHGTISGIAKLKPTNQDSDDSELEG